MYNADIHDQMSYIHIKVKYQTQILIFLKIRQTNTRGKKIMSVIMLGERHKLA